MSRTNNVAWIARACCVLGAASLVAGCTGASELLSKDAEWFSRPSRLFSDDLSVTAAPLTPVKPVTPDDLVGADGSCAGMSVVESPETNVMQGETAVAAPVNPGNFGFDSTECDIVRFAGLPNTTEIGANENSERTVVLTYVGGPRPGVYRFTAGRLTSIERAPMPEPPPRAAKSTKRRG